jgi:branched-subunit amino acid aminotransferase/4-amino-4-deoxychorismate lyase
MQADPASETLHVRLEAIPETPRPYCLLPMLHPLTPERENPLAVCKGCLGPWSAGALAAAREAGAQDALLHWPDGTLAETAIAVVGLLEGSRFTLPPAAGRVRSIAEVWDLPGWADERGWEVRHAPIPLQAARQGQLWCFNALRGLWPALTEN